MSKAKDTPSESIAEAANTTDWAMDTRGRRITVSKLDALQYYRLAKAMGAVSSNQAAMDFAMIAATVRKIDATKFPIPSTERDVEFMIQQLGFEGINAAGVALEKLNRQDEEAKKAEEEAAKN
ncbi:hypothetical protein [Bradyrhizobium lablabi]|uniref:hypothetical protein n=1 Tax=Bradyrhizobium lablabi TaxID=722472 RepID=UPI001BA69C19|nr:hypothetical protein [Bradyrhizobium lablabi]MBR0693679.1 hypothetical protein [Bradyrhizobium lablabi]